MTDPMTPEDIAAMPGMCEECGFAVTYCNQVTADRSTYERGLRDAGMSGVAARDRAAKVYPPLVRGDERLRPIHLPATHPPLPEPGEGDRQKAFHAAQLDGKCDPEMCFDAGWDAVIAALTLPEQPRPVDEVDYWNGIAAELGYPSVCEALEHLSELKEARPVDDVERLREAISNALACTPWVRAGQIVYDCGDPWEILRSALGHKDRGGE